MSYIFFPALHIVAPRPSNVSNLREKQCFCARNDYLFGTERNRLAALNARKSPKINRAEPTTNKQIESERWLIFSTYPWQSGQCCSSKPVLKTLRKCEWAQAAPRILWIRLEFHCDSIESMRMCSIAADISAVHIIYIHIWYIII